MTDAHDVEEEIGHRYLAATAALERGEIERARRDFEILLLDVPRFAPVWDGLGRCHEAEGDLRKAGECYRKAMRLDHQNWRSPYNWGAALHRSGDFRGANRWLRDASRKAPEERRITQRLGQCAFDAGEYDDAIRWYRRALEQPEREITDAELYVNLGAAEAERGDFEAAEKAYERACLISPDNPEVYYQWALLSARREQAADAARLATRAAALSPRSVRYAMLRVNLALDHADWDAASARIGDLARVPGAARLAKALSGELSRRQGETGLARRLAVEALGMEGPPSDQAVDAALCTLRQLHGIVGPCRGFRLLVEADRGEQSYYRPYVVLAQDEEQARGFVAELQDALDHDPWRVLETEYFQSEGECLAGIYQVLLTRVLFPREGSFYPAPRGA